MLVFLLFDILISLQDTIQKIKVNHMKVVGLYKYLPIENKESLLDLELDKPNPSGRDILVAVQAVSVNPVDTKIRAPKQDVEEKPKVLGWDAAGKVVAIGDKVKHFQVGDEVYYAGDITRSGSNAEFQLIDERIVGKKPSKLSFSEAAALPLTTITAWESLFDKLGICKEGRHAGKTLLVIGGAGGVGSITIQLAKNLAKLKVIATASRSETHDWVEKLGADHIINHRNSIDDELENISIETVDYVLCLNSTEQHWQAMVNVIKPQGKICSIVDTKEAVDINLLKPKSATFVWEFMYTRSMFQTEDMIEQQNILNSVAQLVDEGKINTTLNKVVSPINAKNLRQVHADIEMGNAIGKTVLSGWYK